LGQPLAETRKKIQREKTGDSPTFVLSFKKKLSCFFDVACSREWETEFRPLTYPQADKIVQRLKKQGVLGQADKAERWGTMHYLQRLHDAGWIIFDRNLLGEAASRVYPPSMKDLVLYRFDEASVRLFSPASPILSLRL